MVLPSTRGPPLTTPAFSGCFFVMAFTNSFSAIAGAGVGVSGEITGGMAAFSGGFTIGVISSVLRNSPPGSNGESVDRDSV